MKSSLLIKCLVLLNGITIFSQEKTKIIDLKGNWKFSIGINDSWAAYSFNDSEWENIKVPSSWENQGFYGYNGFAAYRKSVIIPSKYKGYIFYIDLGYIDDVDEVFFNGELIGSTGSFPPRYESAYNAKREYYLPEDLIKYDQKNIISVKVYDAQQEGGIVGGNIGIYVSGIPINLDLNLQGKWKFRTGDNEAYKNPGYSDDQWDNIFVPSFWENQGYRDYDGDAWYRKTFKYNKDLPGDKLIILLGKIDDIDEVYINGEYVGSTGTFNSGDNSSNYYQSLRGYYFSKSLLKLNSLNTIAVRVRDFRSGGGIYDGPIGIISMDKYIDYWRNRKESNW